MGFYFFSIILFFFILEEAAELGLPCPPRGAGDRAGS